MRQLILLTGLLVLKYGHFNAYTTNFTMLLQPKKLKYKKSHKGSLFFLNFRSNSLKFGTIGLKVIESGFISSRNIEAARQAINRKLKRKGKLWIRIFPHSPITSKSTGTRMGKGKGSVSHYSAKVGGGTLVFELCGVTFSSAKAAFQTGGAKLPLKTKIIW